MPGHQFDNGLNDADGRVIAEAEADLQRLLSVEPSPELAAKVRMKINAERREPRRWMAGWRFAFAAASIVIVGVIVGLVAMRRGTANVPPAPSLANSQPAPAVMPQPGATKHEPRIASREPRPFDVAPHTTEPGVTVGSSRRQGPEPGEGRTAKEPEVLVPPDQRIAIARALAMSRTGALDERMFTEPPSTVAVADAPLAPPIVVEDVVVSPITISGGDIEKEFGRD